jgi:hypothetical protein
MTDAKITDDKAVGALATAFLSAKTVNTRQDSRLTRLTFAIVTIPFLIPVIA